jgi:hypothetical protein
MALNPQQRKKNNYEEKNFRMKAKRNYLADPGR